MIITPANFEDEYNKIMESAVLRTNPAKDVFNLMCDTLEYLGYGATIRRIRDDDNQKSTTEQ